MFEVVTAMVKTDMNANWMRNNPQLVVSTLLEFVDDHPPALWDCSIVPSIYPGMTISLIAKRKED